MKGIDGPAGQAIVRSPDNGQGNKNVLIDLIQFANKADIDLLAAARRKLQVNAARFPVERVRGSARRSHRTDSSGTGSGSDDNHSG